MSDISVALERIRSLERAAQTPFTGNAVAFLEVLSGHLDTGPPVAAASATMATMAGVSEASTGFEPSEQLRLDGVLRSRFLPAAPPGPGAGSGRLLRPVDGAVTSPLGDRIHPVTGEHRHHDGVDFAAAQGTPIRAAEEGVVSFAGVQSGYGNVVIVDHPGLGGGIQTVYAHQSRIGVAQGDHVSRGQVIGAVGSTGMATGPHLHFEVREGGRAVDPLPYL
jgi:murein DD-endopeptidase MepM/ murein hydrolase activator NlpD